MPTKAPAARFVVGEEDRYAATLNPHRTVAVGPPESRVVQGDRRCGLHRDMDMAVGGFGLQRRKSHVTEGHSEYRDAR